MRNKLFVFFVLLLLVVPFSFAVPPQTQLADTGFTIEYPKYEYTKKDQEFQLHSHVFNSSGYLLTNESVSCYLHITNSSGHIVVDSVMFYDDTFYFNLSKNNFSSVGKYSYGINCNDSAQGGIVSGLFYVTPSGEELGSVDVSGSLGIVLFVMSISFLFLFLGFNHRRFNKLELTDFIIKKSCLIIGVYLMVLNSTIILSVAEYSHIPLFDELFVYTWLFGWFGYGMIVYLLFSTLLKSLKMWSISKKHRRFG